MKTKKGKKLRLEKITIQDLEKIRGKDGDQQVDDTRYCQLAPGTTNMPIFC
jgi:hypothetical protein